MSVMCWHGQSKQSLALEMVFCRGKPARSKVAVKSHWLSAGDKIERPKLLTTNTVQHGHAVSHVQAAQIMEPALLIITVTFKTSLSDIRN